MFFFNMTSGNQPNNDGSMKQKSYNNDLVMASIESLYEQANCMDRPNTANLQRHNSNNLPIVGSLPVQIGHEQETPRLTAQICTSSTIP